MRLKATVLKLGKFYGTANISCSLDCCLEVSTCPEISTTSHLSTGFLGFQTNSLNLLEFHSVLNTSHAVSRI